MTETDYYAGAAMPDMLDLGPEARALAERRMVEAILFASDRPLSIADLAERLPEDADIKGHLAQLIDDYAGRGIELITVADKYFFRTSADLAFLLRREVDEPRKLSRAGVETLAIIAYHQPVTRAEIEDIRGVMTSKGTLDVLMESGWVRPMGRKRTPGRPVTYGTTEDFLIHFGIESLKDLPGLSELQAAGLLDSVDEALEAMERQARARADDPQIDLEDAINASTKSAGAEARGDGNQPDLLSDEGVEEDDFPEDDSI